MISLAAAAHILHVLPSRTTDRAGDGAAIVTHLLSTIDETAAGSLRRCHLALEADGRAHNYPADEWLPYVYDETAEELHQASPTAQPPSLIEHAEQAGRWAALAIGASTATHPPPPKRSPTASPTSSSSAFSPTSPTAAPPRRARRSRACRRRAQGGAIARSSLGRRVTGSRDRAAA